MANEVNFQYISGKTLTFSVYKKDGTEREAGTSLTETPASSGLYLGTPTIIVGGDNVVIKEGSDVVGGGEYAIELALETTIADDNPDGSSVDQTFTLASGSSSNNAYKYMAISLTDISGSVVQTKRVTGYVGNSRKVTVDEAFVFPIAIGDRVRIWADTYSQTADAATITDIVDAVYGALDEDYLTQGTKGLKIHHSGHGRY